MGIHRACRFTAEFAKVEPPEGDQPDDRLPILLIPPLVAHQLACARDFFLSPRFLLPLPGILLQVTKLQRFKDESLSQDSEQMRPVESLGGARGRFLGPLRGFFQVGVPEPAESETLGGEFGYLSQENLRLPRHLAAREDECADVRPVRTALGRAGDHCKSVWT